MITEDLPSSGKPEHQHSFQLVKEDATSMTLVCTKDGCAATKVVPKAKSPQTESTPKPPVLYG